MLFAKANQEGNYLYQNRKDKEKAFNKVLAEMLPDLLVCFPELENTLTDDLGAFLSKKTAKMLVAGSSLTAKKSFHVVSSIFYMKMRKCSLTDQRIVFSCRV